MYGFVWHAVLAAFWHIAFLAHRLPPSLTPCISSRQIISLHDSAFHCLITPPMLTHAEFLSTSRHVYSLTDFNGPLIVWSLTGTESLSLDNAKPSPCVSQPPTDTMGASYLSAITRTGGKDIAEIFLAEDSTYKHYKTIPLPTIDCARTCFTPSPVSPAHMQLVVVDHHVYNEVTIVSVPAHGGGESVMRTIR